MRVDLHLKDIIDSANTGLDAIKRAPIVDYDSGIKCLRIQDVSQNKDFSNWGYCNVEQRNYNKFRLIEGDIIIARTGATIGVNMFINKNMTSVFNNGLIRLRTNKAQCLPKYLFYNLRTNNFKSFIESISGGTSTQPNMQINALLSYEISLPPLSTQKAIAEVLSSLDDKIDLLHRQNKTLEQMAETLFRQWFIEEDNQIKTDNKTTLITNFTYDKFSKWIVGTLGGDWGKENLQGDFNTPAFCIRGTDIADLNKGIPYKTPLRFIKENKFKKIEPSEGDIIIEISGGTESQSTGRVTYINQDIKNLFSQPLVFSNFCRMIKVKKPEYSFFIYCYINFLYNQDEFFNLENGSSGIKNLDYKALLFELDYKMPSENLVIMFHETVQPYFKKINKNKTQITTLITMRDTLLPKLIKGEIKLI